MAENTTTATPLQAGPQGPGSRRWAALALLCLAQLMLILDITVVNVALPDIGSGLGIGRGTLTWVLTAYTMVFGGLMLPGGRLADRYGARRILLTGLVIFVAASLVSGTAVDGATLIGGRAAQGIGAALLSPSALSLVTTMFTGAERNKALGAWAAVGGSGAALGVIAGGILTSAAGWAWVFFVNVPIGLAVLLAVSVVIPASAPSPGRRRIDGPGAVTITAATGAAIYGLVNAGTSGWVSVSVLAPIGVATVLYGAFGVRERWTAHPLIDPRVLRQRAVAVGAFLMLIATGLLVGAFFLGSFYLQRTRGFSALATGLAFLPVAVATVAGAHTGGRLATSWDRRALGAAALALTAAGAAVAAAWHSPVVLIAGMSIAALGIGATLVTAMTTALADVPPGEAGVRSGLVSTFHEFGSALGVAVLSSLAASSVATAGPGAASLTGFTRAFAASAIAAVAAAVMVALLAPPGRAVPGAAPMAH